MKTFFRFIQFASTYLSNRFIKSIFLSFIMSFLGILPLKSQVDSLLKTYNTATSNTIKANTLLALSKFYMNVYDSVHAKQYAYELIKVSTQQKDTLNLYRGVNILGNISFQYKDYQPSLSYHKQALLLAKSIRNTELEASMLYNIGNDYFALNENYNAYMAYIEGVEATKHCECKDAKSYLNTNLAELCAEFNDYHSALFWGKQVLLATRDESEWRIEILKDLAIYHLALNQLDSAGYYANWAYQDVLKTNFVAKKVAILAVKSDIEAANGTVKLAMDYAQAAYNIVQTLPDKEVAAVIHISYANALMLSGNLGKAKDILLQTEKYILSATVLHYRLPKIYQLLVHIEKLTNPQKAYVYENRGLIVQDSLNKVSYKNLLALFSVQSTLTLKESENKRLQSEAEAKAQTSRILAYTLGVISILLTILIFLYLKNRYQNKELSRLNQMTTEQNQELLASNLRMTHFTHTLSHDALGYINNILNYSRLGKTVDDPKDMAFSVEKILKNASNLKKMAQNLILSNSANKEIVATNVILNTIISEILEDTHIVVSGNLVTSQADRQFVVFANQEFVKQIFNNLVSNAVKFRKPNEAFQLSISAEEKGSFVETRIQDNGIGIAPYHLPLLFQEFTKLDRSVAGNGLGLFICKQLVEKMGGKIWATSTLGEGSIFYFTLPLNQVGKVD